MKQIILTKEQYCYKENLSPKKFKDLKDAMSYVQKKDRKEKEQALKELIQFQNS
jgi:hypothetical protein